MTSHSRASVDGKSLYTVTLDIAAGTPSDGTIGARTTVRPNTYVAGICNPDPSFSVQGCVTLNFWVHSSTTLYYIDLENTQTAWSILSGPVQLVSGAVTLKAAGRTCNGPLLSLVSHTYTHSYPSNGYAYQDTPPWAGTYVQTYAAGGSGQSAYTTLTWKRGTATYYLYVNYNFPDNGGWPQDDICK